MAVVLRALLALAAEMFVCYLCGELVLRNFYKGICHVFTDILVGFLICQSIFEVITLGCYFGGRGLASVTAIWLAVAGVICLLGAVTLFRMILTKKVNFRSKCRIFPILAAIAAVIVFCYYVSVNGELNEDSRYYISLVNTTLNTGTLFQYNPYNGVYGNSWYLRRALATYDIHSAMLCSVFKIPALVVTRVTRACQNVVFTSMAVYLLGSRVLWRNRECDAGGNGKSKHDGGQVRSCYLVVLFLFLQLVYAGTYPSSATFFLIRAYEGKALTANLLVLLTMYLCAEFIICRQKRFVFLLAFALWGATAISSSATVVIGIEIGILLAAYAMKWLVERHKERKNVRN